MAAGMVGISIYMGIGDEPPQRVTQVGAPLKLEIGHGGRAIAYLDLNELIDAIRVTVEQIYKGQFMSPAKGGGDDVR